MLAVIREVQIPLLAVLLIGACAAKAGRVLRSRSMGAGLGPTALFPLRLRRPVAVAMCAIELALGVALLLTAGHWTPAVAATVVRVATALLFATAMGALAELREHRPDVGCGCFGDLSAAPVSLRTIARSALLALAAASSVGVPPIVLQPPGMAVAMRVCVLAAEIVLLASLSPEIGEALVRLGYSEPCELRQFPAARTLAALRKTRAWRRHAGLLTSEQPVDVWRELCWRFAVFPAERSGREAEVVFAVAMRPRRPAVRAVVVDLLTGSVLPADEPAPAEMAELASFLAAPAAEPSSFYKPLKLSSSHARKHERTADTPVRGR